MNPIESSKPVLHLFRALLRAATYLPDGTARTYVHRHVVLNFRNARVATPERLHRARKSLSLITRAGYGEFDALTKVLFLAYGRAGRRRRELIADLVKVDEGAHPQDDQQVVELSKKRTMGDVEEVPLHIKYPKLIALIDSQHRNNFIESPRAAIRHTRPKIPKESIWMRPLSKKMQRAHIRNWWSSTLDKIMPPLPVKEWDRLRGLATGAIPWDGVRRRRSSSIASEAFVDDDKFVSRPMSATARPLLAATILERKRHNITAQYMRRMLSEVWKITPRMLKNENSGKWEVTWGRSRSNLAKGRLSQPSKADLELFEGAQAVNKPSGRRPRRTDLSHRAVEISTPK
jgi:hypothetical protein